MQVPIHFFAEDVAFTLQDEALVTRWLSHIISQNQRSIEGLTFIFCSDRYLLKLNQDHLNHDYFTDILTFPYQYDPILADIYISLDRINDNAKSLGVDPSVELDRVMAHGVLHLLGYNDQSPEEKAEMRSQEDQALKLKESLKKDGNVPRGTC
jgi:probable rRNA maturation factor